MSEQLSAWQLILNGDGHKRLFNQYGVMLVNPEKYPFVKKELGQAFVNAGRSS